MAKKIKAQKICSVKGCDRPVRARGWCQRHYDLWRLNGDPLKSFRTEKGVITQFIEEIILRYDQDTCLIWPFSKHKAGYGTYLDKRSGKIVEVHRYLCERVYGLPIGDARNALHSCGNANCVNLKHLYWGTNKQNTADALRHGTLKARGATNPNSKLTEQDVKMIRSLRGKLSGREIAKRFSMSPAQICRIQLHQGWNVMHLIKRHD